MRDPWLETITRPARYIAATRRLHRRHRLANHASPTIGMPSSDPTPLTAN